MPSAASTAVLDELVVGRRRSKPVQSGSETRKVTHAGRDGAAASTTRSLARAAASSDERRAPDRGQERDER